MNPQKVLLYYGFTPIADPVAIQLWQKNLCEALNLKGRILISPTGINGTVGGDIDDLRKYVKYTKKYPGFKKIGFKWSYFPLSISRTKSREVSTSGTIAFLNLPILASN